MHGAGTVSQEYTSGLLKLKGTVLSLPLCNTEKVRVSMQVSNNFKFILHNFNDKQKMFQENKQCKGYISVQKPPGLKGPYF